MGIKGDQVKAALKKISKEKKKKKKKNVLYQIIAH